MANAAVYARVSTPEQDLSHQTDSLLDYARETLGYDVSHVLRDKSTGTDTDRSGYRDVLSLVESGDVDAVVVRSISRISRNMRDLYETVGLIVEDHNCGLYVKNDGLEIPPGEGLDIQDRALLNSFAFAAELEAELTRERVLEGLRAAEAAGKWTKRPPYGFTTDDEGYLQPSEDFQQAVRAILAVEEQGWSHRKASRHTGVPRRTVPNLLDRKALYLRELDTGSG